MIEEDDGVLYRASNTKFHDDAWKSRGGLGRVRHLSLSTVRFWDILLTTGIDRRKVSRFTALSDDFPDDRSAVAVETFVKVALGCAYLCRGSRNQFS